MDIRIALPYHLDGGARNSGDDCVGCERETRQVLRSLPPSGVCAEQAQSSTIAAARPILRGPEAYFEVTPHRADAAAAFTPISAAVNASSAWSPGGEPSDGTGRRIFEGACANCHAWNGNGQQSARAGLAGSHAVNDPQGANLIRVILESTSAADHARQPPCRRLARPTLMSKSPPSPNMPSLISPASGGRSRQRTSRTSGHE